MSFLKLKFGKNHPNTSNDDFNWQNPWAELGASSNIDRVREKRAKSLMKFDAREKEKEIPTSTLKGKFEGKPALVMGSGPSVNRIDIKRFIDRYNPLKFNCNYWYRGFNHRPDYWFGIDTKCFRECIGHLNADVPIVTNPPSRYRKTIHKRTWACRSKSAFDAYFTYSYELERPYSVANIMTLYSIFMGCNPIYIIGVDLSTVKTENNYFYSGTNNKSYSLRFRDFSSNYKFIIEEFENMKRDSKRLGIRIYNLDPEPENFNLFEIARI